MCTVKPQCTWNQSGNLILTTLNVTISLIIQLHLENTACLRHDRLQFVTWMTCVEKLDCKFPWGCMTSNYIVCRFYFIFKIFVVVFFLTVKIKKGSPIISMSQEHVTFEPRSSLRLPNTRRHVNVLEALTRGNRDPLSPSHPVRTSQAVSDGISIIKN